MPLGFLSGWRGRWANRRALFSSFWVSCEGTQLTALYVYISMWISMRHSYTSHKQMSSADLHTKQARQAHVSVS